MIWVDREAEKIASHKKPLEWVDDMKTPSGRIHVGSLRGVIVHDLIFKALREKGIDARFSYVFNDMDPMDAIPAYLDQKKWSIHAGKSLFRVPSPEPGFKSFADFYAKEFITVFNSLNCNPEIIVSSELYKSGKMDAVIKLFLDRADLVRDIYKRVAKTEKAADWYPYNPICEKCGNIGTTNVYKWDGKEVFYRCEKNMVEWAQGCGHEGKVKPEGLNGKLPWKLDWPAHWKVIGITVESSGKDHMSSGGSYDMAAHFCREILDMEPPEAMGGYEWFTIGGRKMSSSKGVGTSAVEVTKILPPEVFRFMLVRTPVATHLDFNPYGETIPNLFDEYDRLMNAYYLKLENKLPKGKLGEVQSDFARIIELSRVRPNPAGRIFLPRFRTIVNLVKSKNHGLLQFFEKQKGGKFSDDEKKILEERIFYAKKYTAEYAEEKTQSVRKVFSANPDQKKFLEFLAAQLEKITAEDKTVFQNAVFTSIKESGIKPKEAFTAFYNCLTGKPYGPKAADLIAETGLRETVKLLKSAGESRTKTATRLFPTLNNPEIFSIDPVMAEKYPSINIGIAVIKNVKITKNNPELSAEVRNFISTQSALTNEVIGTYPEILTYRKLYKEMGLDWHSKRPSPEALLRRIALKKGLYEINTCVDAYNLIVMKNRVSVGAFDYDRLAFPTVLRFPKAGEKILLLGDTDETDYKSTDLAYFDRAGGYNIYFNYRDAKRTAVTEMTRDIILNIDGIYDITREKVEQSLKESIEIITRYCGGEVETAGIVSAS